MFRSRGHSCTEHNTNFVTDVTARCTGYQVYTNLKEMVPVIVVTEILDITVISCLKNYNISESAYASILRWYGQPDNQVWCAHSKGGL